MALMVCPECGHQISDKARVCVHCGYELSAGTQEKAEESVEKGQTAKKGNKVLDEYSRTVFREVTAMGTKWKEQDKMTKKIQFWLKVLVGAIGILACLFLMVDAKEQPSMSKWNVLVLVFRLLSIGVICWCAEKATDRLGVAIKEEKQLQDLKAWDKEKYYFYMKNAKLRSVEKVEIIEGNELYDENYLYLKIKELATRLEVPSIRKKIIFGNIIFFLGLGLLAFVGIAVSLYFLIAVYNSFDTEEMVIKVMLPILIGGIVVFVVAFAIQHSYVMGKIQKQEEWLEKVKGTTLEIEKKAKAEEERLLALEQERAQTEI